MTSTNVGTFGGGENSRKVLKRGSKLPRRNSHHIFTPGGLKYYPKREQTGKLNAAAFDNQLGDTREQVRQRQRINEREKCGNMFKGSHTGAGISKAI
jgi:hypothetical protein